MTPEARERLRKLLAEATPGEWASEFTGGTLWIGTSKGAFKLGALIASIDFDETYTARAKAARNANAALIVAAVNALPELLDALDEADARVEVPAGWQLVPIEPTEAMIEACDAAVGEWRKTLSPDEAMIRSYRPEGQLRFIASATPEEKHVIRYRAMLAAAPPRAALTEQGEP